MISRGLIVFEDSFNKCPAVKEANYIPVYGG